MVDFQYPEQCTLDTLREIMRLLRAPGGCPWDAAQTHQSIRRNMLEEAYEAAEAIDEENPEHLKEELGDVLLQVVFHACMAQEKGWFTMDDVIEGICKKLVFRHPHVFGSVQAQNTDQALTAWEAQKQEEKGQKTAGDTLDAVARSLPALMRAEKLTSKASKAGFAWPNVEQALDKLAEEVDELRQAVREHSNIREELGDVLYAATSAGYVLGEDSEQALHATCEKFICRFRDVERQTQGRPLNQLSTEEQMELWKAAKQHTT